MGGGARILGRYRDADFVTRLKARFVLVLDLSLLSLIAAILAYSLVIQSSSPAENRETDARIIAVQLAALVLFALAAALVVAGRYRAGAFLSVAAATAGIWAVMFLDRTEALARLDSIVFILAILCMSPLAIIRHRREIILLVAANLAFLWALMLVEGPGMGLSPRSFRDYLADSSAAILFAGFVSFSIQGITDRALRRSDEERAQRARADEELRRSQEALERSERTFRGLAEASPLALFIHQRGRIVYANPAAESLLGYSLGELLAMEDPSLIAGEELRARLRKRAEDREAGLSPPQGMQIRVTTKSGEELWVAVNAEAIDYEGGPAALSILTDLTERVRQEDALRLSEARYRGVVESQSEMIARFDASGRIVFTNLAWRKYYRRYLGLELEPVGLFIPDIMQIKDFAEVSRYLSTLEPGQELGTMERRFRDKDGCDRWQRWQIQCIVTGTPEEREYQVVGIDITSQKESEEALRESEARYRSIIAVSNTGALEYHGDTGRIWCSPEYLAMLGKGPLPPSEDGLADMREIWIDRLHPDDRERATKVFEEYLEREPSGMYESVFRMRHEDGRWIWVWSRGQRLRGPDGRPTDLTVGTHIDITESKRTEDELKRLNAELESKVAARTADLAHTNLELQAVNVGLARAMEELKEAQGRILVSEKLAALGRIAASLAHELNTPLAAIAASSRIERRSLGSDLDAVARAAARLRPETLDLVAEARRRCELRHGTGHALGTREGRRGRSEAAALLAAAGVAGAEEAAEELADLGLADLAPQAAGILAGPEGQDFLLVLGGTIVPLEAAFVAEEAVDKASRVISTLRTYARGEALEAPAPLPLDAEFAQLAEAFRASRERGVSIELEAAPDAVALARKEDMERILVNLVTNAVQAAGPGGLVEAAARRSGAEVLVSIRDSGPGIPEESKPRIFEPFFTTKPPGEAAGLGLDMARRLARSNGGDITFESGPGRTVFTLRVPAAPAGPG